MEEKEIHNDQEAWSRMERDHRRGKVFSGILIVAAGSLFLAKELGADIPGWIFTWKMFLIALGLIIGVKHKFRNPGWLILVLVGGAFLVSDLYPGIALKPILWPVLVILFGLFIIFKPRRKRKEHYWRKWQKHQQHRRRSFDMSCSKEETDNQEVLDCTIFMGGTKKNILNKDFKGGEVVAVFGGTEINFLQADFEDTVTLDVVAVFAGVKLILPANWEVQSELVSAFGSIEDKRPVQPKNSEEKTKILVLKGTVFFGGIDIKSY